MSRVVKYILAINLAILAVLAFVYPHLMEGPGKLIPGHQSLESNCFSCHTALRGARSEKCVACHKPADIGRLTSAGQALTKPRTSTPFHQKLISQDCVACHSDHAGVKRYEQKGGFKHALLVQETRKQCQSCHKSPRDALHQQITGNCVQCHSQDKWTPATFEHDQYFVLDRDHDTRCVTCHVRNDYSRSTCYGCHEHTPSNIRRKHIEEGISQFDNCVECHRSANEDDIRDGQNGRGDQDNKRGQHERERD